MKYCLVMPKLMLPQPCKFGNVRKSFFAIWNGKEHIGFLLDMLTDKNKYITCASCEMHSALIEKADRLDDYRDNLIAKYTALFSSAEQQDGAQI